MAKKPQLKVSSRDRLMSRPEEPLPTPLDPQSPQARGFPVDPKPTPATGQGDPEATDPAPEDLDRSS